MATGAPPDYYAILDIGESATAQQVRDAYKRAALKSHPDRVPVDSPERPARTRKFQLINDAYYTLSDTGRRREYDAQRKLFPGSSRKSTKATPPADDDPFAEYDDDTADEEIPTQGAGPGSGGANAFSWAWNFFSNRSGGPPQGDRRQTENAQFSDVFEEMMREEGLAEDDGTNRPTSKFWSVVGGLSGGALGFIVANVPGLVAGAVAGNRLGAVRDAKGKSVYAVFQELPQDDKARLLSQLAARVFSHVVSA
ncbi:hypothetical protein RJ55_00348 [Drechmeria coniospora]|nr:hypothetical protein RJ55_00348 [Drechmeria coniospora]